MRRPFDWHVLHPFDCHVLDSFLCQSHLIVLNQARLSVLASLASFVSCCIAEESPAAQCNGAPSVNQAQRLSLAPPVAVRGRIGHCAVCSVPDGHTITPWYETITTLPKMIACDTLSLKGPKKQRGRKMRGTPLVCIGTRARVAYALTAFHRLARSRSPHTRDAI